MNNIDRWPEAFENGIPKVGGRWLSPLGSIHVIAGVTEDRVLFGVDRWNYLDRYTGEIGSHRALTFLGFSDPPAGAAAPQAVSGKPPIHPLPEWYRTSGYVNPEVLGGCACGKWVVDKNPEYTFHSDGVRHSAWTCTPIHAPAPVPAPPPSRPADAPLAILPQTGTRHETLEALAQGFEGGGNLRSAKEFYQKAAAALPLDLAYDAEASAIREGRIVLKSKLAQMGAGDRRCFDLRGLREFSVMASPAHGLWNWWKR